MNNQPVFHNFDLYITASHDNSFETGHYFLSVQQSLAGETREPVKIQIDLAEPSIQEALTGLEYQDISRQALENFGIQLTNWLLPPGPVRNRYQQSLGKAETLGNRLRLRLRIDPPELSTLPWEYIYDESTQEFFALKNDTALVRYHNQPIAPMTMLQQTPIAILILMAEPEGVNALPYSHTELVSLLQALQHLREQGILQVDILYGGTSRLAIQSELEQFEGVHLLDENLSIDMVGSLLHRNAYHVVHYIGHSQFDEELGGVLLLTDSENRVTVVGAEKLARVVQGSNTSVVVLNACESAEDGTTRSYMGLAPRLIQAGIPAVVAMQYVIPDQAAMHFSQVLYQSLADGQPLDAAVVAGRIALTPLTQSDFSMDWGIPALFMRAHDGSLWKTDSQQEEVRASLQRFSEQIQPAPHGPEAFIQSGINRYIDYLKKESSRNSQGGPYRGLLTYRLGDADIFFGRERDVELLLNHLDISHLTVLHAESGAGKSSLLHAGLTPRLIARKHLPIYVRAYNLSPTEALKRLLVKNLEQEPLLLADSLRDFLYRISDILEPETKLYIILDQFEEFFLLLDEPTQSGFIHELADCLEDLTLEVYWLISLRSERFGDLASFRPRIPNPFGNDHRLNRMNRDQAYMIIDKPAARYGVFFEEGLIARLVEGLSHASEETGPASPEDEGVVPSQLQLVCLALYEELEPKQKMIDRTLYERLGGVAGILQNHLEKVLRRGLPADQRGTARFLLEALITSQTHRVMRTRTELSTELNLYGIDDASVDQVLDQMIAERLLRVTDSHEELEPVYELAHDYLIQEIELSADVKERKQAQELLESEVFTWRASETLISPERLKILSKQRSLLYFDDLAAELLIRSALEVSQDVEVWFQIASPDLLQEVLLDSLKHGNSAVRTCTITHLAPYFDADIEQQLNQIATDDDHPEVQKATLTLLADQRSPFAQQIALRNLQHREPEVCYHAILILQQINTVDHSQIDDVKAEMQERLFTLATSEDDQATWTQALIALNGQEIELSENESDSVSEERGLIYYVQKIPLSMMKRSPAEAYWSPLLKASLVRQSAIYCEVVRNSTINLPRSTQLSLLCAHHLHLGWLQIYNYPVRVSVIILFVAILLFAGYNNLKNARLESKWALYPYPGFGTQQDEISTVNVANDQTLMLGTYHYGPIWSNDNGWQNDDKGFHEYRRAWNAADQSANRSAIYAMAKSGEYLYALVSEGIYRYSNAEDQWRLLILQNTEGMLVQPGDPFCTPRREISACKSLAIYGEQLLLLGEVELGIWSSGNNGDSWEKLQEENDMLNGEFSSVLFDDEGRPYAAGRDGIYRGNGNYPWDWEVIDSEMMVQNMAIGSDSRLYLAIVDPEGGETPKIGCYNINDKDEFSLRHAPVTNRLSNIFDPIGVQSIEPHPDNPNIYYLADNFGAIYKMNCDGDAIQIGKKPQAVNSLAIQQQNGMLNLLWGNHSGLFQYKENLMEESNRPVQTR